MEPTENAGELAARAGGVREDSSERPGRKDDLAGRAVLGKEKGP